MCSGGYLDVTCRITVRYSVKHLEEYSGVVRLVPLSGRSPFVRRTNDLDDS